MERLYLVVRADLPPGDQATQAAHALAAFAVDHPEALRTWQLGNKNLVLVAIPTEAALRALYENAHAHARAKFEEPDIGGEMTAIALSGDARKLVSSLPLALRAPKAA